MDSQEIEEFVKSALDGISKGLGKAYRLSGDVEFELAVVNVKRGEGGLRRARLSGCLEDSEPCRSYLELLDDPRGTLPLLFHAKKSARFIPSQSRRHFVLGLWRA